MKRECREGNGGGIFQRTCLTFFCYVYGSVHRESMSIMVQQDATMYSLLYFCKLIYMFRVVIPPIIRSIYKCNYSIWHWSNSLCYLLLSWSRWNAVPTAWNAVPTASNAVQTAWNAVPTASR